MSLALDPDKGNVLVAFESKGAVYTTLAKAKGPGFKAKKAKVVSDKSGNNHRPNAAFDAAAGEFVVAWDTGPASLSDASVDARLGQLPTSDILARRISRKKGKGTKSVVTVQSDGNTNIGPVFGYDEDRLNLMFTSHATTPGSSRAEFATLRMFESIFRAAGLDAPKDVGELLRGLVQIRSAVTQDRGRCLAFASYLNRNRTARYGAVDLEDELYEQLEGATPTVFDFVLTMAVTSILDEVGRWVHAWNEGDDDEEEDEDDRRARPAVFYEVRNAKDVAVTSSKPLGSPTAFAASNAVAPHTADRAGHRAGGAPVIAAAQPDGKGRLFVFNSETNTYEVSQELFTHKGTNVRALDLLDLGDGRLLLAYTLIKNAKQDEIFLLVIDL